MYINWEANSKDICKDTCLYQTSRIKWQLRNYSKQASNLLRILAILLCFNQISSDKVCENALQSQIVKVGSSVELSCKIINHSGTWLWFKGSAWVKNEDITENQEWFNLTLRNVTIEDDDSYYIHIVLGVDPQLRSEKVQITVLVPPKTPVIQDGPVLYLVHNVPTNLTCTAYDANPAPSVEWHLNNEVVLDSIETQVEQDKLFNVSSTLPFMPNKNENQERLTCQVWNNATLSPLWTRVSLVIQFAPEVSIIQYSQVQSSDKFHVITMECEAKALPESVKWKWFLGDQEIQGQTSSLLNIKEESHILHESSISCQATNEIGAGEKEQKIELMYGPYFPNQPLTDEVDIGDPAQLECQVLSFPKAEIRWYRENSNTAIIHGPILEIAEVLEADLGKYICEASSGTRTKRMEYFIFQKGPPSLSLNETSYASVGDTAELRFTVVSVPKPTAVSWFRNGIPLPISSEERYDQRVEDLFNGQVVILKIIAITDRDFARYSVKVDNGYGAVTLTVQLKEKAMKPTKPSDSGSVKNTVVSSILAVCLSILIPFMVRLTDCGISRKSELDATFSRHRKTDFISSKLEITTNRHFQTGFIFLKLEITLPRYRLLFNI